MEVEPRSTDRITKEPQLPQLAFPLRITEQVWPEGTVPLVTIRCITYNHVKFIRKAVDGFLMQKTTFPVEIIIHDDASNDGTADIVRDYQATYPQLLRTVLQAENQHSKGIRPQRFVDPLVRGEFTAICEGDDYWTDPLKLQKQIDLLTANPAASGSFHAASVVDESGLELEVRPARPVPRTLTFEEVVNCNHLLTCCLVYRTASAPPNPRWSEKLPMADWPLQVELARRGALVGIDHNMGCYRRHSGGLWTRKSKRQEWDAIDSFYRAVRKAFGESLPPSFFLRSRQHRWNCLEQSMRERDFLSAGRHLFSVFFSFWADTLRAWKSY